MITLNEMWFFTSGAIVGLISMFLYIKYFIIPELLKDYERKIIKKFKASIRKCD
jgi:hypothetical protein